MTSNFAYTDPDGNTLELVASQGAPAAVLIATDVASGSVAAIRLKLQDIPAAVTAMYEAAGSDDWRPVAGRTGADVPLDLYRPPTGEASAT